MRMNLINSLAISYYPLCNICVTTAFCAKCLKLKPVQNVYCDTAYGEKNNCFCQKSCKCVPKSATGLATCRNRSINISTAFYAKCIKLKPGQSSACILWYLCSVSGKIPIVRAKNPVAMRIMIFWSSIISRHLCIHSNTKSCLNRNSISCACSE